MTTLGRSSTTSELRVEINIKAATISVFDWEYGRPDELVWIWAPGDPIEPTSVPVFEALLHQLLKDHWMSRINEGDFDEILGPDGLPRWVSRPGAF